MESHNLEEFHSDGKWVLWVEGGVERWPFISHGPLPRDLKLSTLCPYYTGLFHSLCAILLPPKSMWARNIDHLENPTSATGIPSPPLLPTAAQVRSLLRLTYSLQEAGSWPHPLIGTSWREVTLICKQG